MALGIRQIKENIDEAINVLSRYTRQEPSVIMEVINSYGLDNIVPEDIKRKIKIAPERGVHALISYLWPLYLNENELKRRLYGDSPNPEYYGIDVIK